MVKSSESVGLDRIPFTQPFIGEEEAAAAAEVVRSGWLSQGERVARFEEEFARYVGCKEAIAVANGTVALHLTMIVAGVGPGDEVIVPSFTFVSTSNAALFQDAVPVFADIDPDTYNISPEDIEAKITARTRAIIPVHYAGQVADMAPIMAIARKHNLIVVEDAAEAHGARYDGRHAGVFADMAIFSFTPTKNMTTGEGGFIVTDNPDYAARLRLLRNHGMDSPYHYVALGYNYRLTEVQAAIGLVQLGRLDYILECKDRIVGSYNSCLGELPGVVVPRLSPHTTRHGYMLYTLRVPREQRDRLIKGLGERGIESKVYFPPVHLQPYYRSRFGFQKGMLPVTERVADEVVSLPVFPALTGGQVERIVESVRAVLGK